jgi:hypothetical protein
MEEVGKYLENKKFIRWVFEPDPELDAFWTQFRIDHPEEKETFSLPETYCSGSVPKIKSFPTRKKSSCFPGC